jgi:CBS domain containing-hemolysin-like protein
MEPILVTLIFYLLIALGVSFLCSLLEAVVLSITPAYIAAQRGTYGKRLEVMKRDIDRPLAAILTLNTFAHTLGAAGVGAAAQDLWGRESLTIVSSVVTIIILIGSEIIPKTLGAVYWQSLGRPVVWITRWLTWILLPAVWGCQLITRPFRRAGRHSVLSRADVSQVVQLGFRDGLVLEHERDIIANLMTLENLRTVDIMTPREKLVALDENAPLSRIGPSSPAWHISRIPLLSDNGTGVTSYVLKDEVLVEQLAGRRNQTLSSLRRPILKVAASSTLEELYESLIADSEHIAVVIGAQGDLAGVVTMEDLIEALLGQMIVDESDVARGEHS